MEWYTGITLGPIYDTLQLTSSPAGLWGASSLFSWIAYRMLCSLMQQGLNSEDFISPCFQWDDQNKKTILEGCEDMRGCGVGMLHDRIIFAGKGLDKCKKALDQVINELSGRISEAINHSEQHEVVMSPEQIRSWLSAYLRIHAIEVLVHEEQSPILYIGERLASIELEPNFVISEKINPLLLLFNNAGAYHIDDDKISVAQEHKRASNEKIKNSFLVSDKQKWMLSYGNNQIRDIEHIACRRKEDQHWKTANYYVVLQSDGDGMGALLQTLKDKTAIKEYSSKCLSFCAKAANLMLNYGALPIYAGGDDLMAILPLIGNNPRYVKGKTEPEFITIWGMVNILLETFNCLFSKERETHRGDNNQPLPTISFGLSIQYVKSPLYEAIEHSRDMLGKAKSGAKNTLCLRLEKHSGSPLELKIGNLDGIINGAKLPETLLSYLDKLILDMRASILEAKEKGNRSDFLSGIGYQCEKHRKLFEYAIGQIIEKHNPAILHNLFINLFDNVEQKKFSEFIGRIEELALKVILETWSSCPVNSEEIHSEMASMLFDVIRVLRFTLEKGGKSM